MNDHAVRFEDFLTPTDAGRAMRVLEKLRILGLTEFALVGGLALELNLAGSGKRQRALNDIDIIVPGFSSLPGILNDEFLVCHIHPRATAGRLLLQVVDAEEALRVDVFRGREGAMMRSRLVGFDVPTLRVQSIEDCAAGVAASTLMRLNGGEAVSLKTGADFEMLCEVHDPTGIEIAWNDHRQPNDPCRFADARARIIDSFRAGCNQPANPARSRDVTSECPRCEEAARFRLSSANKIIRDIGGDELVLLVRERGLKAPFQQ